MNTTTPEICCGTTMDEQQTLLYWLPGEGFPVFMERHYACGTCGASRFIDINEPEDRERIAGHVADPKGLAPLCCLENMTEMEPDITLHPVAVYRVFLCDYCLEYKSFPVTDDAKRDQIISACITEVDE